jgi:hypothetical protein
MTAKVKYEVIEDFKDLQDKNKVYFKGDTYPKPANKNIPDERIEELLSHDNKRKRPVIQIIEVDEQITPPVEGKQADSDEETDVTKKDGNKAADKSDTKK